MGIEMEVTPDGMRVPGKQIPRGGVRFVRRSPDCDGVCGGGAAGRWGFDDRECGGGVGFVPGVLGDFGEGCRAVAAISTIIKASDMAQEFIERRGDGYYFVRSRVSLDSIVYQFLQGESPEAIVQAFPSLTLLQVYGGITFYLNRRSEVDAWLKRSEAHFDEMARRRGMRVRCFTPSWMRRGNRQPEPDAASISGRRRL